MTTETKQRKLQKAVDILEKQKRANMKKAQEQMGGCFSLIATAVLTAFLVKKIG